MIKYRHDAWDRLVGAPVEIRKDGNVIRSGRVDGAMPDSSVIWLAADEWEPRALFEAALGFEVWVEPRQLAGKLSYRMTASALHHEDKPRGRLSSSG
ncbi:hypothetical protein [Arthrobacter sp. D1-17]